MAPSPARGRGGTHDASTWPVSSWCPVRAGRRHDRARGATAALALTHARPALQVAASGRFQATLSHGRRVACGATARQAPAQRRQAAAQRRQWPSACRSHSAAQPAHAATASVHTASTSSSPRWIDASTRRQAAAQAMPSAMQRTMERGSRSSRQANAHCRLAAAQSRHARRHSSFCRSFIAPFSPPLRLCPPLSALSTPEMKPDHCARQRGGLFGSAQSDRSSRFGRRARSHRGGGKPGFRGYHLASVASVRQRTLRGKFGSVVSRMNSAFRGLAGVTFSFD